MTMELNNKKEKKITREYCPFGQNEIKNLKIARWIFF